MSMLSRFATLGSAPPDPYWNNVSLLLVGNGANGTSTNIKDSSNNNITITNTGGTVISTTVNPPAVSNAGSGTVYFNGTSNFLSTAASSLFGFGTGDFTIEFWLYYTGGSGYVDFINTLPDAGGGNYIFYGLNTGTTTPFMWNEGNVVVGNTNITSNTWQFHTIVRNGTSLTIYLNGQAIANTTWGVDLGSSRPIKIGATSAGVQSTKGYFYDVRVTKGVARYTANFTPPPFPPTAAMPTY